MARTFNKRGLRRDRNFGDIPNPELALNNVLEGLIQVEGDRFISADLDVIRGLSATGLSNSDMRNIDNAALRGTDPTDPLAVFRPIITLQNRFDQARFTIGDPQFFGGDGLTTRYYRQEDVNVFANQYDDIVNPVDATIFTGPDGTPTNSQIFWENGQYSFIGSIHESLPELYGAIEWNGFFVPNRSGSWRFIVNTTGLFSFEFNSHGANVVGDTDSFTTKKVHPVMTIATEFPDTSLVGPVAGGQVSDTTQFGEEVINQILEGDIVTGNVAPFDDPNNPVTVTGIDRENRIVEFSAEYEGGATTVDLDYNHPFGVSGRMEYNTDNLTAYVAYPVRFRYMWVEAFSEENNPTELEVNEINFVNVPPGGTSRNLNYRFLYSENYDTDPEIGSVESGDFFEFFNDRIPPGGTRLVLNNDGSIGTTDGFSGYQNVITLGNLVSTYEPPRNYSDAVFEKSLSFSPGSSILSTGNTDGIEVGNIVLGNDVPPGTVVESIARNEAVFISNEITATESGSQTFYFGDHQGLKYFDQSVSYSSGSSTISNIDSTADLDEGDVVIVNGTTSSSLWTRIDSIDSGSQVSTTRNLDGSAPSSPEDFLLVYHDSGVNDESLETYCSINPGDDLCTPPVDTSAPFISTEEGLVTPTATPNIEMTDPAGEVKFVKLKVSTATVNTADTSDTYNISIPVKDGNGNSFSILGSTA